MYSVSFGASELTWINKSGLTQFRLQFSTTNNNNNKDDQLKLISGAEVEDQPSLTITYSAP